MILFDAQAILATALPAAGAATGLHPEPDRARALLRRELLDPDYHQDSLLQRVSDWLDRLFGQATGVATAGGWLSMIAVVLVLFVLLGVVTLLATRVQRSGHTPTATPGALPEVRLSAAQHRDQADRALNVEDHSTAAVEAFRAVVMRLVESGHLDDRPGATASELAREIARLRPDLDAAVRSGANQFDQVLYGEHTVTGAAVRALLDLDDALAGVRR